MPNSRDQLQPSSITVTASDDMPRSKFAIHYDHNKSPLDNLINITTKEMVTLSTSSIYESESESSSSRSSQDLHGLGIYWDSTEMAQNSPVALSLSQVNQQAFLVSGSIRDDKPLPPLPRESLYPKDLREREWDELVRMPSGNPLNERDPLCAEEGIVDVQPQARLKEKHYTLPQKPAPKHFDHLDRAIMRAALHPKPLLIHNKRARSMITDDQGDSTLLNPALPMTGAHSSIGAEASHNLLVTAPTLETERPRKVHLLTPEGHNKRKMTSSGIGSLWGSMIRQVNRITRFSSSQKIRQASSSHPVWTSSSEFSVRKQKCGFTPVSTRRLSTTSEHTELSLARIIPPVPDTTTSPTRSQGPGSASKPTINIVARMQRVFSVLVGESMPPATIQRLRAEDELLLQGVIEELKLTLIESLPCGVGFQQLLPSMPGSQQSGGPDASPALSEEISFTELPLPDSSATFSCRSIYELETTPAGPNVPEYSGLWKDTSDSGCPQRHDGIILSILRQLDSLDDLFNMATINRKTYWVFKAHEITLVQDCLWKMSPAAWEHCEVTNRTYVSQTQPGGQNLHVSLYLRHYRLDLYTLVQFKSLLLYHCQHILRENSYNALLDPWSSRSKELDDAIWRVWTFCDLFAVWKERECDFAGQISWLRGNIAPRSPMGSPDASDFTSVLFDPPSSFAQGNRGGLTQAQLRDMVEIWTAMATLLDFLRDETERARRFGIFARAGEDDVDSGSEKLLLKGWIDYLVSLGPAAVLSIVPAGPQTDPEVAFLHAQARGWTMWTKRLPSEASRSAFLTGPISSLYCALQRNSGSTSRSVT